MSMTFKWVKPPRKLAYAVLEYQKKALVAVQAAAAYVGLQMQNAARSNAPWEDRTGNARSGLFYAVDGFGLTPMVGQVPAAPAALATDTAGVSGDKDRLVLALGHTVYYGRFLELSHGGQHAIVMSTIEAHLGTLEGLLRQMFK